MKATCYPFSILSVCWWYLSSVLAVRGAMFWPPLSISYKHRLHGIHFIKLILLKLEFNRNITKHFEMERTELNWVKSYKKVLSLDTLVDERTGPGQHLITMECRSNCLETSPTLALVWARQYRMYCWTETIWRGQAANSVTLWPGCMR